MIHRVLENVIAKHFFRGKAIIITGPRQVGKTTLVKRLSDSVGEKTLWINGDEADTNDLLANATSTRLKSLIGNNKLLVIDEAQKINKIGLTLKLIVDNLKDIQVIVTRSSSLDIANHLNEPLTGRKFEYNLYPISFEEMVNHTSEIEETRLLEHRLVYGYYPDIINNPGEEQKLIQLITSSYLYKDVLALEQIRKPVLIDKMLQALALQMGNEVSYNELGQLVGADKETVEKYIDLLEKSFVIFTLQSLNRNMRSELKKSKKIYFWDNGVRNAIIKNFNPLNLRQDVGALWENFMITERIKHNHYRQLYTNSWFWRTVTQQEIDYVEEYEGKLHAYEFKWSDDKIRFPKSFSEVYPGSELKHVTRKNFKEIIL